MMITHTARPRSQSMAPRQVQLSTPLLTGGHPSWLLIALEPPSPPPHPPCELATPYFGLPLCSMEILLLDRYLIILTGLVSLLSPLDPKDKGSYEFLSVSPMLGIQ